jgi:protease I
MSLQGKDVLLIGAHLFEEAELIYPLYRMQEEGANVTVSGIESHKASLQGKHGYKISIDRTVEHVDMDSIHCVILPGGYGPDAIRNDERVQEIVHHVHSKGGVVAAICHGPWILVSAGLLKDRDCTGYSTIRDDIINAGGHYQDASVVVDNRIVTSRHPGDLPDFCRAVISEVKKLNF